MEFRKIYKFINPQTFSNPSKFHAHVISHLNFILVKFIWRERIPE